MTGQGSVRHNNRTFSAANVDKKRTSQNIVFCREDLKQVYHMLFDESLAAYNAKKKKTRDKIPDYYEHIKNGKQEKLFHEAIFQIGNLENCGCGTSAGKLAATVLQQFAVSFQERNPNLRVFNMVLHMDEATPHLHVDFVPTATEQARGLSTRVSMKQALKQQGFISLGRNKTEWAAWMEKEKGTLGTIAREHHFEIINLDSSRPHMDLPEYKAAMHQLEETKQKVAMLEEQGNALEASTRLLKAVEMVNANLDTIQPEKTVLGALKGISTEQVSQLKAMAIRGAVAEQREQMLLQENKQLKNKLPSLKQQRQEIQRRQQTEEENRNLRIENDFLKERLSREKAFSERILQGIQMVLSFLEQYLPTELQPLLEKARQILPLPEPVEEEQDHSWEIEL